MKAKAGFVFPRSQYLQLQEECFNVGLSYELFLRAFGELDILHEDQVKDNQLAGYQVLVLCDVKLLAEQGARNLERFVRHGGMVIADCVPQLNEYKQPLNTLLPLFGVRSAATERTGAGRSLGPVFDARAHHGQRSACEGEQRPA